MKCTGLKPDEQYYRVDAYSMKCRLYPNKEQSRAIDEIIHGVHVAYNIAMHDMFVEHRNTNEVIDESTNEIVHFPNVKNAAKSEYLTELRKRHDHVKKVPAGALSGNNGVFLSDMNRALIAQSQTTHARPIEKSKPAYYSKKKPRTSYSYQELFSKISFGDNRNVFHISLAKVGNVKVRGWNQNIRFGQNADMDFISYVKANPSKQITITVLKDACKDYYIVFKLSYSSKKKSGVHTYVKARKAPVCHEIGIDVGIKSLATCSDGIIYENLRYLKAQKSKIERIQRRVSRRYGWSNADFRSDFKNNCELRPSKRFESAKHRLAVLHRDIAKMRSLHNNSVSKDIVNRASFIGVESLNIKGMFRNRHLAYALSDVGMGAFLSMLKYKTAWYGRELVEIGRWVPSSKTCHCCGYKYRDMTLDIREWDCPVCHAHHGRDLNAALNILAFAKEVCAPLKMAA